MSSPLVSIAQADIDGWAGAVQTAVTAIQSIVASGTLQPAQEQTMNDAIAALQSALPTPTPPPAPGP